MIVYKDNLNDITPDMISGYCVGWGNPLSAKQLFSILQNSYEIVIAVKHNKIIGFVHAISDKVKFAFIPMFEVLPEHQNKGIGTELLEQLFKQLKDIDNIDLICDKDVQAYYEKFGMIKYTGMVIRK